MCQGKNINEPKDKSFRSFWIKPVTNKPGPRYYDTLKDRFVHHAQVPERTKALVFALVFVLAHEQAISTCFCHSHTCKRLTCLATRMKRRVQPCFFPLSKSHSQILPDFIRETFLQSGTLIFSHWRYLLCCPHLEWLRLSGPHGTSQRSYHCLLMIIWTCGRQQLAKKNLKAFWKKELIKSHQVMTKDDGPFRKQDLSCSEREL